MVWGGLFLLPNFSHPLSFLVLLHCPDKAGFFSLFGLLGVQVLLERDAELLAQGLELLQILGVLALVLDLGLDACVENVGLAKWLWVCGCCGLGGWENGMVEEGL